VGSNEKPERLLEATAELAGPNPCFFVDGGTGLVIEVRRVGTGRDVMRLDIATGKLDDLLCTEAAEVSPALSADGEWLAYGSSEHGRPEVFLTRFAAPTLRWQVSVAGGLDPQWSPDGLTLYFLAKGNNDNADLWAVDVEPGVEPRLHPPRPMIEDFAHWESYKPSFVITRTGRFLTADPGQGSGPAGRELRLLSR
jgi:Tol biopolymer transport system component